MANFFIMLTLLVCACQSLILQADEAVVIHTSCHECTKAKPATPAPSTQQGPIQYIYYIAGQPMPPLPQQATPSNPNTPPVQYIYVPYTPGQQPSIPHQPAAQKPTEDGPNVAEVMTTFAGVLGGIVAMGMGAEYGNPEQEAQGLNTFIQSGAQLISILTRQPCTKEQFVHFYVRSAQKLMRSRKMIDA